MFLLIRTVDTADRFIQSVFTFHNVSINTEIDAKIDEMVADFTFHNVSINTVAYGMAETAPISVFTFHNVSINTSAILRPQIANIVLYIPQCFY